MECLQPKYLSSRDMVVPCGGCPFCAATKRSDWALRLHYEGKLHYGSKFVTLTYADNELSWNKGVSQLNKRDLQLWFKKVRKEGWKFRYYAVGEYGSRTYRPHYHIIVFGDVPDKTLRKAWGKGHVHIGSVTQQSVMYTLGYIVNGKHWTMKHNRVRPFAVMSRGRGAVKGLGSNYLTPAMIAWHRSGRKNYAILDGVRRHLPRYYKQKIFSKIDLVRIAVRDQKEVFRNKVKWLRAPAQARQKDPLKTLKMAQLMLANSIRSKTKQNLII